MLDCTLRGSVSWLITCIEFSAIQYLMKFVGQDLDYVAQSDDERVRNMQDVDKLAELLSATR